MRLIFLLIFSGTSSDSNEFAFVQYFKVTSSIEPADEALLCLVLRRASEDRSDHSVGLEFENAPTIEVGE